MKIGAGLFLAAMAAAAPARADWIAAMGEYRFPPEMAEADACRAAAERAKEEAIRQVTGERLSSAQLMRCTDQGGKPDCALNSSVWTQLDGDVRATRNEQRDVTAGPEGYRQCTVKLEAEVVVPEGKPDPGFDIGVVPNAAVYRDGEEMRIGLRPTRKMAVAIFEWLPYAHGADQIARIYPNRFDPEQTIDGPTIVPTAAGAERYAMKVAFPEDQPASRKVLDEYLVVVATREPVDFLPAYTFDEFHARLLELSRSDSRIVRQAYNVVRGN